LPGKVTYTSHKLEAGDGEHAIRTGQRTALDRNARPSRASITLRTSSLFHLCLWTSIITSNASSVERGSACPVRTQRGRRRRFFAPCSRQACARGTGRMENGSGENRLPLLHLALCANVLLGRECTTEERVYGFVVREGLERKDACRNCCLDVLRMREQPRATNI